MKIPARNSNILPAIIFSFLAVGCAAQSQHEVAQQPVARQQVVDNLEPILKVEERVRKLTRVMQHLPLVVEVKAEDAQKLKEHYNLYSIYHNAATISLAEGNFQAYSNHLQIASRELDSLEARLHNVVNNGSPRSEKRTQ
jgi:uncharacterized protein YcfL